MPAPSLAGGGDGTRADADEDLTNPGPRRQLNLYHRVDFPDAGYDGVLEPAMTICVESYIGEEGGREGVKLEQQVLITENGYELLSNFPFEENLIG